mmetsp:Transcript_4730/g.8539  ORF Transcript_4730/g.8539 Transcript_4730/m.8539 type:complete len:81 (+) Transcript_4730:299-541(+)
MRALQTGLAVVALSRSKEWARVAFEIPPDRQTLMGLGNRPFDKLVTAELQRCRELAERTARHAPMAREWEELCERARQGM